MCATFPPEKTDKGGPAFRRHFLLEETEDKGGVFMNKTAFYNLSYGVYLCTSWDEGRPVGCVANSAMQITAEPATLAVSLNHGNYTNR